MNYLNKTELGYLEELEGQLGEFKSSEAAGEAAVDIGELCKKYHEIKGTIELALKGIEKIPVIGKKIAKAVRFLMNVADLVCPGNDGDGAELAGTENADTGGTITLSLEQIEAFERLDAALGGSTESSGFALSAFEAGEAAFNKDEICAQYKKIRKFLKPLLPIINALPIPGIGAIVSAITLLMGIADSICGTD